MTNEWALHLTVLGQEPLTTGRFGCDYAWNDDFTSYRMLPHRWRPGSDSSYAAWQAGDLDDDTGYRTDEAEPAGTRGWESATRVTFESEMRDSDDDHIPF